MTQIVGIVMGIAWEQEKKTDMIARVARHQQEQTIVTAGIHRTELRMKTGMTVIGAVAADFVAVEMKITTSVIHRDAQAGTEVRNAEDIGMTPVVTSEATTQMRKQGAGAKRKDGKFGLPPEGHAGTCYSRHVSIAPPQIP